MGAQIDLCRQIYLNLALNSIGNVIVYPYAAGASAQKRNFFSNPNDRGSSGLCDGQRPGLIQSEVFVRPLDKFMLQRHVALIKIDAVGSGLDILRGAKQLLSRAHPVLHMEIWDGDKHAKEGFVSTRKETIQLLCDFGYDTENTIQ